MPILVCTASLFMAACVLPLAGWGDDQPARVQGSPGLVNVLDHGAKGDGRSVETAALNAAIAACARAGGGRVRFPPGRFLSGTLHLRRGVTLYFDAGARLIGTTNLAEYRQPTRPDFLPEARWGKWHRALILGEQVEDIAIDASINRAVGGIRR